MKFPAGLRSFLTRKPTLIAGGGIAVVALLGGVALALQPDSGKRSTTSSAQSPSCVPKPKPSPKNRVTGQVTTVTATAITLKDAVGTTTTFALSPSTRVSGPKNAPLQLASIRVGDYVMVQFGKRKAAATPGASPQPGAAASPAPPQPGARAPRNAVAILDYGATPPKPKASPKTPSTTCPTPST